MSKRLLCSQILPLLALLPACPVERAADAYCRDLCDHTTSTTSTAPASSSSPMLPSPTTSDTGEIPTTAETSPDLGSSDASTTGTALPPPWNDESPKITAIRINGDQPILGPGMIEVSVDCIDDHWIPRVELRLDNVLLATLEVIPFNAYWPLNLKQIAAGKVTIKAECNDGHSAPAIAEVVVPLADVPKDSSAELWFELPLFPGRNAEALAATVAPDGTWWTCGYAGDEAWVAHYDLERKIVFLHNISEPFDTLRCRAAIVPGGDPDEVILTGYSGSDPPSLWAVHIDATAKPPIKSSAPPGVSGFAGNDIVVMPDGAVLIVGQAGTNENSAMAWYIFHDNDLGDVIQHHNYMGGAGSTATSVLVNATNNIYVYGAFVKKLNSPSRGAMIQLDHLYEVVESGNSPYISYDVNNPMFTSLMIGAAMNADGSMLAVGSWMLQPDDDKSNIFQQHFSASGLVLEAPQKTPSLTLEEGRDVIFLSDGSHVITSRVANGTAYMARTVRMLNDVEVWSVNEPFAPNHEPFALARNLLDQILVAGSEEFFLKGKKMRRIRLRGYKG